MGEPALTDGIRWQIIWQRSASTSASILFDYVLIIVVRNHPSIAAEYARHGSSPISPAVAARGVRRPDHLDGTCGSQ